MDEDKKDPVVTEEVKDEVKKDRTGEQFEKLTDSNKTLKAENEQLKDLVSALTPDPVPDEQTKKEVVVPQAQQYNNLSQSDIDETYKSMIDEQGYLDGNRLMATLKSMDERVKQAEQVSESVRRQAEAERVAREENNKSKEVESLHAKYPELDPKNSDIFDREFYDLVRNEMVGQLLDGKQDPLAAADKWADKRAMNKADKEKKEQADEAKSQINTGMPRSTQERGHYEKQESDSLRTSIQAGKRGALAEMLRRREQGKA